MNIRKRNYIVEYYRVRLKEGKFDSKIYNTNFFLAFSAVIYHNFMNLFSLDKICCRIIGSYVSVL